MSWSTRFEDPIALPNGKKLITLKDAATYITGLPKKQSALPEWQTAIEVLMLCNRGGDPMMAKIGFLKACTATGCASSRPTAKRRIGASGS